MKNCKIVQDLLPNYIEKLTNEETNHYIEEHLKECEECSKKLNAMKSNIDIEKNNELKKETKYLKKYSRKLRIFKFIVFAIILIFLVDLGRKMIIINSLQNKISQYENLDEYYLKTYYIEENFTSISEAYKKGEKYKLLSYYTTSMGLTNKYEVYGNGEKLNTYNTVHYLNEGKEIKRAVLDGHYQASSLGEIIETWKFKTNSLYELILMALTSNVSLDKCNGKECYKIDKLIVMGNSAVPEIFYQDKYKIVYYIEKETGLILRKIDRSENEIEYVVKQDKERDRIIDYDYNFENIADEVFEDSNINEYKDRNDYELDKNGHKIYFSYK